MSSALQHYVRGVVANGELDFEIARLQTQLIAAHQVPRPDRDLVVHLTQVFKALLSAKQLREEAIHDIRNHNRGPAQNGGARVADHTTPSVRVGNVLQEDVTGR